VKQFQPINGKALWLSHYFGLTADRLIAVLGGFVGKLLLGVR
jgi:hypothetical protein